MASTTRLAMRRQIMTWWGHRDPLRRDRDRLSCSQNFWMLSNGQQHESRSLHQLVWISASVGIDLSSSKIKGSRKLGWDFLTCSNIMLSCCLENKLELSFVSYWKEVLCLRVSDKSVENCHSDNDAFINMPPAPDRRSVAHKMFRCFQNLIVWKRSWHYKSLGQAVRILNLLVLIFKKFFQLNKHLALSV